MIINSTNSINVLEDELMPFLNQDKENKMPCFAITESFPWIVTAREQLEAMME